MDTTKISFERDFIASEQDEFFVLELIVLSPTGDDASSIDTSLPNVFFRSRQNFTIIDTTGKLDVIYVCIYLDHVIYICTLPFMQCQKR